MAVAVASRDRWTIEGGFQKLATVLESEIDTLASPKAALCCFAVGAAAYNVRSVVQAALRSEHGQERVQEKVALFALGEELATVTKGMQIAVPLKTGLGRAAGRVTDFSRWLRKVAGHVDWEQYEKHPRGPKKKPKKLR